MKTSSFHSLLRRSAFGKTALLSIACFCGTANLSLGASANISELLERGIYSEETKGDLDAAMQLYQQIINEADAGQAVAIQAQFRLAMCYDKKKDYVAATAAFEKLVASYPAQNEYVKLANDYLADGAALLPSPWVNGEELRYQLKTSAGVKIGLGRFTVDGGEINGQKIWRFTSHLHFGMQQWGQAKVSVDSFKPIHSRWQHPMVGEAEVNYVGRGADVKIKGKEGVKHADLKGIVYDNEQAIHLMRRLPLAAGYRTTMSLFVGISGATIPVELTVTGPETVNVPFGKSECFKVALSIGQTFWYSADAHRYLVKYEGGGIISELASIHQRAPEKSMTVRDELFGSSFKTPPGGFAERMDGENEQRWSTYLFMDPHATAMMKLKIESLDRLDAAVRESPRTFAEHKISQGKKAAQKFEVRSDSWRTLSIDGHPAIGYIAEVVQGPKTQIFSGVYGFVDGKAVEIWYATAAENFEAFGPHLDAVVDSYRAK